jgi:hypothetical protein
VIVLVSSTFHHGWTNISSLTLMAAAVPALGGVLHTMPSDSAICVAAVLDAGAVGPASQLWSTLDNLTCVMLILRALQV